MTISLHTTDAVQTNAATAQGVLTAQKAKSQQELEGEMALNLIQSAAPAQTVQPSQPSANLGQHINIRV